MKFTFFIVCLFLSSHAILAQNEVSNIFMRDTMWLPEKNKVLEGEYLETTLKNLSVVRLYKTNEGRIFLRFIVTKNFYFDKVGVLEIKSGSKSYYAKETKQHKINKTTGLFIVEVFKNYIFTLKNDGITGLVFSEAETDFTKHDTQQIRKMASFFYDSIAGEKK